MISCNLFLARRFIGRRTHENFLWFISVISVLGIALGVISLMLVLGVMNGFSNDLKRKIVGANPTITVEGRPLLRSFRGLMERITASVPEVRGISPYLNSQVIFKSSRYMIGGILRGVDPSTEPTVTNLPEFFTSGSISAVNDGIALGSELARELSVTVGDDIWVMGGAAPVEYHFRVIGIVEYGVYNYDVTTGVTAIENMQRMFGIGDAVHGIGIRTDDIYRSAGVAGRVQDIVREWESDQPSVSEHRPPTVSTWTQKNKILFAALALEKKAMAVILILIVLVASFNIASTLMITVFRKTREIGILKAIGLSSSDIRRIFLLQGLTIGCTGLALGVSVGGVLAWLLKKYQFIRLPEFIYNLSRLPIALSFFDILSISAAVIIIVTIASLYPAHRASLLNPAEALRYD